MHAAETDDGTRSPTISATAVQCHMLGCKSTQRADDDARASRLARSVAEHVAVAC